MEDVAVWIQSIVDIMSFPMEIWGFELSFWSIMIALIAGGIVINLIARFFDE